MCSGECKPGSKDCGGTTVSGVLTLVTVPRVCGDDAMWQGLSTCGDATCLEGACVGECSVGAARCTSAGEAQTCNSKGVWAAGGFVSCTALNYALGARVDSPTSTEFGTFSRQGLVDGRTDTAFSSGVHDSATVPGAECAEYVQIAMTANATFSTVVLIPRRDPGYEGFGFAPDFKIQVFNGVEWLDRRTVTNLNRPTTPQRYSWSPADLSTGVRVCATRLGEAEPGAFYLQLEELQVLP